jgi:hypothetical protein
VYIVGVFLFIFDISNGFVISNISDTLREPFKISKKTYDSRRKFIGTSKPSKLLQNSPIRKFRETSRGNRHCCVIYYFSE